LSNIFSYIYIVATWLRQTATSVTPLKDIISYLISYSQIYIVVLGEVYLIGTIISNIIFILYRILYFYYI